MYRKSLYLLLCLLVCLCAPALAEEPEILVCGKYEYFLNPDGTATIAKHHSFDRDVTIPNELDGHTVSGIGDDALSSYLKNLTLPSSVTTLNANAFPQSLQQIILPEDHPTLAFVNRALIDKADKRLIVYLPDENFPQEYFSVPQGIVSIGQRAFAGCHALRMVFLPNSVTDIDRRAFYFCYGLEKISFSTNLLRIGEEAFYDCEALQSVELPEGLQSIDDQAFYGCEALQSVELPEGLQSLGSKAFYGCVALQSVHLPDSLTELTGNPFWGCKQLIRFTVSPDHPVLALIDGVLFHKPSKTLVCYPRGLSAYAYSVPEGIRVIGDYAFCMCQTLQSITLPDSVTAIGDHAFASCKLPDINLPNGLTSIGSSAFYGCDFFGTIVLPETLVSIGDNAFCGCNFLETIVLPESLVSLGNSAFSACDSLQSINLPDSLTHVGHNPFRYCRELTDIDLSPDHPALALVDGMLLHKPSKTLISYLEAIASPVCQVPDGIVAIGDDAFCSCDQLESVALPDSLTTIGKTAFAHCDELASVSIPEGVTNIASSAFFYFRDHPPKLVLTVVRDSYAMEYAKQAELPYTYPDSLDWLKE